MNRRYVLSPEAARNLAEIWRHIRDTATVEIADRVESVIRGKIAVLARTPGVGHWRPDLTDQPLRFFAVYSYLIVYRPETKPLHIVAIIHGNRDVGRLLS